MTLGRALRGLGAPGIFLAPPEPVRSITGVRRDITALLGVAPRGPAWLPVDTLEPDTDVAAWLATTRRRRSIAVPVTSWDEYRHHFGGFEGPGRLPYAVSSFFAAGGERAYVIRIVHAHGDRFADARGRASGRFEELTTTGGAPVELFARTEGGWGNGLRATLRFTARPVSFEVSGPRRLVVDLREWIPGGSLLRLRLTGDISELRYVHTSMEEPDPTGPGRCRVLTLDTPVAIFPDRVEVVTASLEVVDGDRVFARRELIDGIGLRADHP
ncbi:hypothetical protein, partial [Rhodococcus sp. T7]